MYPSREPFGDAVHFVTNGVTSLSKSYTVLGVDIENARGPMLSEYNALNESFGLPITVCTNRFAEANLYLLMDVLLSGGVFRLAIENATTPFQVWMPECWTWDDNLCEHIYQPPELLLDSESQDKRHFTMRQWLSLAARRGDGRGLSVFLLAGGDRPQETHLPIG